MAKKLRTPRLAWALTGSGHFVTESLELMAGVADLDLFVSKAAAEVVRMYRDDLNKLPPSARIFRDTTASAAPVGLFYHGVYHTLVLGPATSNTVAKCAFGISDNLATNYAMYVNGETDWNAGSPPPDKVDEAKKRLRISSNRSPHAIRRTAHVSMSGSSITIRPPRSRTRHNSRSVRSWSATWW